MTDLMQLLTAGVSQGAAYGLVAASFVAVFAVTGVVSLVQGQFAAIAAFVAIALTGRGVPLVVAGALALVAVAALAWLIERGVLAGRYDAAPVTHLVTTLGVLVALQGAVLLVWGPEHRGLSPVVDGTFTLGGVVVRWQDLVIVAAAGLVGVVLWAFLTRTTTGRAVVASSQQPTAARLLGIPQARMYRLAFCVGALVAGVAGLVVSPVYLTGWDTGLSLGLKGFVAASVVGLVSLPGAVLAGILLGLLESLAAGYIDTGTKEVVAYLVLLTVLIVNAEGRRRAPALRV
ncbi:branched-chain amino acid ABC transporter permease [Dactylosporangium sp. AC04546]|uniref:branched-chain amino acid ABC transporter permease n=1 Tax=Dactylosporangium sp. AC04546 TaxID=2862460 RepID=UPI001EE003C1|nr:branched-chain amino acid ABC transporter permease [Dactylosporangium sp. AC04546]WVK89007.1 branched-chain amino acid ABC transporter permease [Dactylosporangium sp. AC04546]